MPKIKFEIVTAERVVYSDEVDVLVAPGVDGQLAVLPHHAPLMTMLQPGELLIRKGSEEQSMFVSGGFMEVRGDKIVILADSAERAEEIDTARAEAAKRRAQETIAQRPAKIDQAQAEAAIMRAMARMKVAEKSKRRKNQT
jgi:F-type H+-transporting ATPase subunit epsilon